MASTFSMPSHLQVLQPVLQRVQHPLHLLRRGVRLPRRRRVFTLPLVVVVVCAVTPDRRVVRRLRCEVAMGTLPGAVMRPAVRMGGATSSVAGVRARCAVVLVGMVTEALAQGQLGGELPDGLPLVQDGLLLLDQALPQVEDGGLGLVRHPPPTGGRRPRGAAAVVRRPTGPRPPSHARPPHAWSPHGEAGRVQVHGHGHAHEAGVGSVVVVGAPQGRRRADQQQEHGGEEGGETQGGPGERRGQTHGPCSPGFTFTGTTPSGRRGYVGFLIVTGKGIGQPAITEKE